MFYGFACFQSWVLVTQIRVQTVGAAWNATQATTASVLPVSLVFTARLVSRVDLLSRSRSSGLYGHYGGGVWLTYWCGRNYDVHEQPPTALMIHYSKSIHGIKLKYVMRWFKRRNFMRIMAKCNLSAKITIGDIADLLHHRGSYFHIATAIFDFYVHLTNSTTCNGFHFTGGDILVIYYSLFTSRTYSLLNFNGSCYLFKRTDWLWLFHTFFWVADEDECSGVDPCEHGTCVDAPGTFQCNCDTGYTGLTCEVGRAKYTTLLNTHEQSIIQMVTLLVLGDWLGWV